MHKKILALSICLIAINSSNICQAKLSTRPEADADLANSAPTKKGRVQFNRTGRRLLKGKIDRQVAFADSLMLKGKYSEAADYIQRIFAKKQKQYCCQNRTRDGISQAI